MSAEPAFRFAIVCEAAADREIATHLADRIVCEKASWLDAASLDLHRRWQGYLPEDSHLEWRAVPTIARQRNLRAHGHFDGEPGDPDAWAARLTLLLLSTLPLDAVVLVRDSDGKRTRKGLEQARSARPWPFPVLIGFAHTKRECWVLAGFDPRNPKEEDALAEVRRQLGFDPRHAAEGLHAGAAGAVRDAKRVLALLAPSRDREEACWRDSPLATLVDRGRGNGLADYLEEIRSRLAPVFRKR